MAAASFIIMLSLSAALLISCNADLIGDICSKSSNPPSCDQGLRSDPRSRGADARGLGAIAIDKAQAAIQDSIKAAKAAENSGNKGKIDTCVENFGDAADNLNDCKGLINARDRLSISTLQTRGSAALTDVDTCSDEFGAAEPRLLKEAAAKAYGYIQVLLIIANTL